MSIFVSFTAGAALFYLHRFFPFTSFSLAIILLLMFALSGFRNYRSTRQKKPLSFFAAGIVAVLIMLPLGYYRAASSYSPPPDFERLSGQLIEIKGRPLAEPVELKSGRAPLMSELEVSGASVQGRPLHIEKIRLFTDYPLSVGRSYISVVKLPRDNVFINPGSLFSRDTVPAGYALNARETGKENGNPVERARSRLNTYLAKSFSGDTGAFLMSIITGERRMMSSELKNAFNATGLAHILSISGAHFGLLLFILFKLFRLLVTVLPSRLLLRLSLYISPSQIAAVLCFPIITAYLGISTMEFPAVRAFIMITLFLFGLLVQRKGFWMNTLLFAAAVIVLIRPDSLTQLSFQLSFLAVFCIGLYADLGRIRKEERPLEKKPADEDENQEVAPEDEEPAAGGTALSAMKKMLSSVQRYVSASSMVSLMATVGTAPLVAYAFNYVSIISPLGNLLITPFIGFVILPLSLFSSFAYLLTGIFPFRLLIEAVTDGCLDLIRYMGSWNFAAVPVPSFPPVLLMTFYAGIIFYAVSMQEGEMRRDESLRKKIMIAATAIAVLPLLVYGGSRLITSRPLHVTFLDVGQGDGAVAELPDGRVMVIDTGKNGFQVASFLKYRGCRKIDLLVLTHAHPDHCGGLPLLEKNFRIGETWDNGYMPYRESVHAGTIRRALNRGDAVRTISYAISVFHPYKGFYSSLPEGQIDNDYSAVLKLEGRNHSFLFTGDISEDAERDIAHIGSRLKSTVLKVPHHGSRSSLDKGFLHFVSPEIAVISAGKRNMFGHPHGDTLAAYSKSRVYRTDRDGAVGVEELPDGTLRIRTARELIMEEADTFEKEFGNIKRLFSAW